MLGSSNGLQIFKQKFSQSDAKLVQAGAWVGIDRFVARHFSIGIDLGALYAHVRGYGVDTLEETKATSITGGVRFGYDIPLGELFSWYPRLTLGISSAHTKTSVLPGNGLNVAGAVRAMPESSVSSSIGPVVNLYAPLLLHWVPHFFVGFGPRLQRSFGVERGGRYAGTQTTLVSAELVVGGWWGETAADTAAPAAEEGETSFGKRRQLVLGLATDASASHRTDSAAKRTETAVELAPSADYFVLDNVSVGVDAFIGHSSGTALDANDARIKFASTNVGLGARVGTNVPITKWSCAWPQVELGYGALSTKVSSPAGTNQHSRHREWLRLSAPLLLNVTSHFLLGAGPYFFHELTNTDQFGTENKAESVGLSLLLAGWL